MHPASDKNVVDSHSVTSESCPQTLAPVMGPAEVRLSRQVLGWGLAVTALMLGTIYLFDL